MACYIGAAVGDDLPARRLTASELERVLRRAIELQHTVGKDSDATYTVEDAERLAGEIGVSPQAVRTALVQVQHETLVRAEQPPRLLDRVFGPQWVIATRAVPGPADDVARAISTMLQQQLYQVHRNLGPTMVWAPGSHWIDGVRRALDFSQRYRLTADVLIVTVTDSLDGRGFVDVRLEAGLANRRGTALRRGAAGTIVFGGGTAAAAIGVGAASAAFVPLLAAGALLGGALLVRSRRRYLEAVTDLHTVLERFLDFLEHERPR
jgi:hypothetical protein